MKLEISGIAIIEILVSEFPLTKDNIIIPSSPYSIIKLTDFKLDPLLALKLNK